MKRLTVTPYFDAWLLSSLVTAFYVMAMHRPLEVLVERSYFIGVGCFACWLLKHLSSK